MNAEAIHDLPLPVTYGRHLARLFEPDALLAGTGLSADDLAEPDRRITVRQALRYIHNALALAEDPAWYLAWAGTLADHFHGPISVALMSAPTLGEGLDAFVRYFPSRIPYLHMQGRLDGDRFGAELYPLIDLGDAKPMLVETPVIVLTQHLETVYGVDLREAALELDYPATSYSDRYGEYLRCSVHFDAPRNALVVPAGWRLLPNLGYSESTWAHAIAQCEDTVGSSRERETLGELRTFLCRSFEKEDRERPLPTLDEAAKALGLTSRTMIRRLRSVGTSYQELTDDFLRVRARELLANEDLLIKEVAAALGFESPANFGKAFKRWFGTSPGRYRELGREPGAGA